ncbi:hypothetical protein LMG27198_17290 [Methylocystis echinoides]|uniref:Uncharacterized protein n=2 Tax=Methylocystis echinoides TaxID=29468 RepID=A0A9W6LRR7_9HYPH|nr:hypothetical protein LMG27198_17290 [Methylocystis echinoides]
MADRMTQPLNIISGAERSSRPDETSRVGERPPAPPPKGKTVVIITEVKDRDDLGFSAELARICKNGGVDCTEIQLRSAADLPDKIRELRKRGVIGDSSQVIIKMHGGVLGVDADARHRLGRGSGDNASTYECVKALREPLGQFEKPCHANIYLGTCEAGNKRLREELQQLHNEHEGGACFLLASGKSAPKESHFEALREMCKEFVFSTKSNEPPPTSDQVLARMAIGRTDCMTMIEANRAHPVILHTPKTGNQLGLIGLRKDIEDHALVIIPEKGMIKGTIEGGLANAMVRLQLPSGEAEVYRYDGASFKALILGEHEALLKLDQALAKLEVRHKAAKLTKAQESGIEDRLSCNATRETLQRFLESKAGWAAQIAKDEWNASHEGVLECLIIAAKDTKEARRNDKIEYLFGLMQRQKKGFDDLPGSYRRKIIASSLHSAPLAFEFLMAKGFFLKDTRSGVEDRIREVARVFAEDSDVAGMKSFLSGQMEFSQHYADSAWNQGHQLILEMLASALKDAKHWRDEKADYLLGVLYDFFNKGGTGIDQKSLSEIWKIVRERALGKGANATLEEFGNIIGGIPKCLLDLDISQEEPMIHEALFGAALKDEDPQRRRAKCDYILQTPMVNLEFWMGRASGDEAGAILLSNDALRGHSEGGGAVSNRLTHLVMMLTWALADRHDTRRQEKAQAIINLIWGLKAAFAVATDRSQTLRQLRAEFPDLYSYLQREGFFARK